MWLCWQTDPPLQDATRTAVSSGGITCRTVGLGSQGEAVSSVAGIAVQCSCDQACPPGAMSRVAAVPVRVVLAPKPSEALPRPRPGQPLVRQVEPETVVRISRA